jgi:hypothetical protein
MENTEIYKIELEEEKARVMALFLGRLTYGGVAVFANDKDETVVMLDVIECVKKQFEKQGIKTR